VTWRVEPAVGLLLVASFALALCVGPINLPAEAVGRVLARLAGLPVEADERAMAVVSALRLPRAALAAIVGGALGLCGAIMQGLFRNALADPGVLGISGGASLGAVASIYFGAAAYGLWAMPAAGFVGGLAAAHVVARLARTQGRMPIAALLLAGIAVNAFAMALMGILVYSSDDRQLRDITVWLLGSLSGASWQRVLLVGPAVAAALAAVPFLARALDALILGEREAAHLGIRVELVKRAAVVLVAMATGAVVSVSGPIGFVGLVVPHVVRLTVGAGHRRLLPLSACAGAALLAGADTLARVVVAPAELPVGLVTAAIGAPFFALLLMREKARLAA
jgi:iron complex transport system permease protein